MNQLDAARQVINRTLLSKNYKVHQWNEDCQLIAVAVLFTMFQQGAVNLSIDMDDEMLISYCDMWINHVVSRSYLLKRPGASLKLVK